MGTNRRQGDAKMRERKGQKDEEDQENIDDQGGNSINSLGYLGQFSCHSTCIQSKLRGILYIKG